MKLYGLIIMFLTLGFGALAQKQVPLPHGTVFGTHPSTVGLMPASRLEAFMGKRTRTTAAITGKVLKVTRPKGGWFVLDAGKGQVINAHFKNYNITIPAALKGREVIVYGVAQKQFIADDHQPLAGNTHTDRNRVTKNKKPQLTFEVVGLMVNK